MSGNFCSNCGERKLNNELRSIKYILKDLVEDLTSIDGKLWKTIKILLLQPGQIDHDYHTGRRIAYIKPISLFFILNVLFVMFSSLNDFYVTLSDQLHLQPYSEMIAPHIREYVQSQKISIAEFAQRYDQLVTVLARSLIIIQVPFFAIAVAIIFRNKHYYSGDYFTYALNFHSWIMFLFICSTIPDSIAIYVENSLNLSFTFPRVFFYIIILGLVGYSYFSSKTLFKLSFLQVIWRIPLLLMAYQLCHTIFRFIQLLITTSLVEL